MSRDERGQATVEFAFVLTFILALVMGVIDLGIGMSHALTLNSAVREGARAAGSLANGGGALGCGVGQSPDAASVDPHVVAAVERILTGNGSLVTLSDVTAIRIYKANASGGETSGMVNVWVYAPGGGPLVDGDYLDFALQGSEGWPACQRNNVAPPDSVGVRISYLYHAQTPIGSVLPGLNTISMGDRAVMTINATR